MEPVPGPGDPQSSIFTQKGTPLPRSDARESGTTAPGERLTEPCKNYCLKPFYSHQQSREYSETAKKR